MSGRVNNTDLFLSQFYLLAVLKQYVRRRVGALLSEKGKESVLFSVGKHRSVAIVYHSGCACLRPERVKRDYVIEMTVRQQYALNSRALLGYGFYYSACRYRGVDYQRAPSRYQGVAVCRKGFGAD